MTDLSDTWTVGDGIKLLWTPLDVNGAAITGASALITLTIKEKGETITKTGADLTESPSGTYFFVHKIGKPGTTYGFWAYDGSGNADGVEDFKYYAEPTP